MGARAFFIGILQIVITLNVFTFIFSFNGPFSQAMALGAIIALSSTAIVLRVLVDRAEIDAIHGRNALAILLTQDAAVVPLVLPVTLLGMAEMSKMLLSTYLKHWLPPVAWPQHFMSFFKF